MRDFVEHDGDDEWDQPGRHLEDDIVGGHSACAFHSAARIENRIVSRTWPVQVIRSARITPSRTAPSLAIAACERALRASTRNSMRRKPWSIARPIIKSLTMRLSPVPRMAGT